jgi:hypothetical protein
LFPSVFHVFWSWALHLCCSLLWSFLHLTRGNPPRGNGKMCMMHMHQLLWNRKQHLT